MTSEIMQQWNHLTVHLSVWSLTLLLVHFKLGAF